MHAEATSHEPEGGVRGGDAEAGPPRRARVGERNCARGACGGGVEQRAPVGIAAHYTVEHDQIVHRVVFHVREVVDYAGDPVCDAVLLGQPASHPDRGGRGVHGSGVGDAAPQQLDGDATDACAAFEYGCFMETYDGACDFDQSLRPLREATCAEPASFDACEPLAEDVIQAGTHTITRHCTSGLR